MKYLLWNKEETRVFCTEGIFNYLTGELGNKYVNSFTPHIVTSWLSRIFARLRGYKVHPIGYKDINGMPKTEYIWVESPIGGTYIKVWSVFSPHKPSNCSVIFHSGRIMLKGIGDFTWSDFKEVVL